MVGEGRWRKVPRDLVLVSSKIHVGWSLGSGGESVGMFDIRGYKAKDKSILCSISLPTFPSVIDLSNTVRVSRFEFILCSSFTAMKEVPEVLQSVLR